MRVIAKKILREFWTKHPDCEQQLKSWYQEAENSTWLNPNDIKKDYPFVFELAIYFTRRIEQVFSCTISENEIGFIAMHLGIGLESQKLSNRYRAILIHPYENQVKDQLINFIESKFSSFIFL